MDTLHEYEEKMREAASIGDEDTIRELVNKGVNVNTQHKINGWSPLHWASKRGHATVASLLLSHGANKELLTKKGETALQLSSNPNIRLMLGGSPDLEPKKEELPITPNYIANPPFPYINQTGGQSRLKAANDGPVNLSVNHVNHRQQTPSPGPDTLSPSPQPATTEEDELVLKVRVANAAEKDFIEIELDKNRLTFEALVTTMCKELEVNRKLVQKIRKLPDTIVRKDKDVRRLKDFQEMEVVLTSRAISQSSRSYGLSPKDLDVVY